MIEHSADISVEPPCVTIENYGLINRIRNQTRKPQFSAKFNYFVSLSHVLVLWHNLGDLNLGDLNLGDLNRWL